MAFINITVDTKKVERRFAILSKGLKNFKKPLKGSGKFAVKEFKGNFEVEGAKFKKWKPLSASTMAAKVRMGLSTKILTRTGKMKRSFKLQGLTRFMVRVINPTSYFKFHQSNLPRTKLPRRIMISTNVKMKEEILKIFDIYLKILLKK